MSMAHVITIVNQLFSFVRAARCSWKYITNSVSVSDNDILVTGDDRHLHMYQRADCGRALEEVHTTKLNCLHQRVAGRVVYSVQLQGHCMLYWTMLTRVVC